MSRKWIICIIVILLLPMFTAIVFADDTGDYLKHGKGKVTAGCSTGFKIENKQYGGGGFSMPSDVDYGDIYQGSDNNYLYQLSVSGYSFTHEFYKTRNVYFVDVKDSVTSLQVSAVPCDRKAKVYVAGNQDVSRNFSKIVVDVKAVNGDVRTYIIYVRH